MNGTHGGRVYEAAARLGRPWGDIIDFSANINPLGQPKGLKEALFAEFGRTLHYPEIMAESFVAAASRATGLAEECLLPGAGSSPHLYLLARSLDYAPALAAHPAIIAPAFAEYGAALACAGREPTYVFTREEDDWLVTPKTLAALFDAEPDMVFLANPANPTGRAVPADALGELAEGCRRRHVWLVVDEAFIDFTENGASLINQVVASPRLIVLRSLTKVFALPGLRLAYLAAHPETRAMLAARMEPWPLSAPAITAGCFCLQQREFIEATAPRAAALRERLAAGLRGLGFARVFPSEANYVLIKLRPGLGAAPYLAFLFGRGLLARDASNFRGLAPGYLRLAVRPEGEIEALLAATGDFLGGQHA